MKSVTSYFNSTLYHKTMSRFWPAWAAWTLVLAFMLPLGMLNNYSWNDPESFINFALRLPGQLPIMVAILAVLSVLSAMAVFGYLFNHRSACMLHALPLRRETLFVTQYLAGLSFLILPALVIALLTGVIELFLVDSGMLGLALKSLLVWLLSVGAITVFFFSFAAFCAMFTGHILALPVFFGVLNFLVTALWSLVNMLLESLFYGYSWTFSPRVVDWLTPVYRMINAVGWNTEGTYLENGVYLATGGYMNEPAVLAIYAAAGLVFAAIALMVYRRRQLETAGDVVSVAAVRPLFQIGVSVCVGLFFGTFTTMFFTQNNSLLLCALVVVWSVVGWFAAEMLLQKSLRVFHRWKGCAAMACAMALLCAGCYFDWFGVEARVPQADQVECISGSIYIGAPGDNNHEAFFSEEGDTELLRQLIDLHQTIVDTRPEHYGHTLGNVVRDADGYGWLELRYTMKDGSHLARRYSDLMLSLSDLEQEGTLTCKYNQLINSETLLARAYEMDLLEEGTLTGVELRNVAGYSMNGQLVVTDKSLTQLSGQQREDLLKAARLDMAEGHMGVRYLFNTEERFENTLLSDIAFFFTLPDGDVGEPEVQTGSAYPELEYEKAARGVWITLTPQAVHTLTCLEEFGVLDGSVYLLKHGYQPDVYRPGQFEQTQPDTLLGIENGQLVVVTEHAEIY